MDGRSLDPNSIEIGANPLARSGFRGEVHLPGEIAAEGPQKLDWSVARNVWRPCFHDPGKAYKETHISLHPSGSAWPPNLHDDLASVPQFGGIGLRYGGGGQRLFIELRKVAPPVLAPA